MQFINSGQVSLLTRDYFSAMCLDWEAAACVSVLQQPGKSSHKSPKQKLWITPCKFTVQVSQMFVFTMFPTSYSVKHSLYWY